MTLRALLQSLMDGCDIPMPLARRFVDSLAEAIGAAVARGERVRVPRLGTFYPSSRAARRILGPPGSRDEGQPISLPRIESMAFRPCPEHRREKATVQ
jgi:nucleoid DNA-binding protein